MIESNPQMKLNPSQNKLARVLYLSFGILFLVTGLIGLLIPVLPGWLFLIPALFFFAKSSRSFNRWLRRRKSLSKYFEN
jgi:uncharacterized membrane protein YbaN (DUF454 family)